MSYPYDASRAALFTPARDVQLFPGGRPETDAALCAEMSRLAYAPFEKNGSAKGNVEDTLRRIGFLRPYFFDARGTQGLLASDQEQRVSVLAFRGTQVDPRDVVTDLQAWPRTWSDGARVHDGFACALEAVWDDLGPRLAQAPGRLIYTGHSLGAALATLAAARQPPHALYTYGSPRVGDEAFLRMVAGVESHRYTNCCDMICRVPFELFGYRHLGPALYLDRTGVLKVGPSHSEVSRDHLPARFAYWSRYAWRPGNLWTRDLADHAPVNYYSALSVSQIGP